MSQTLSISLSSALIGRVTLIAGASAGSYSLNGNLNGALAYGTGANNANQAYNEVITLAASGTHSLNLYTMGGAVYPFGAAFTTTRVKKIFCQVLGNLNCGYVVGVAVQSGAAGTGYTVGDSIAIDGTGATGTAAVLSVGSITGAGPTGPVATLNITTPGSYTVNPTNVSNNTTSGGTGTGLHVDLTMGVIAQGNQVYTDGDYLTIGGAGTHPWTGLMSGTKILPSGTLSLPGTWDETSGGQGWPVVSGSSDTLLFTNSGSNPLTFQFTVIGATA